MTVQPVPGPDDLLPGRSLFRTVIQDATFLDMMADIASFLLHFHHYIDMFRVYFIKPRMLNIKLIAKNQAKGFCHKVSVD